MSDPLIGPGSCDGGVAPSVSQQHAAHDRNMVMYLGLFLLLLVFFILLATMSQQRHDRAFATAGSLAAAFGNGGQVGGDVQGGPLPGSAQAIVADGVGRLVQAWSSRLRIEGLSTGERVQFSLPVSAVFSRPDAATLQPEAETFLADLATLVRGATPGAQISIDAVVGSTIVGGWDPDTPPPLPLARAAMLARFLAQDGLGAASLTAGIEVVNVPRIRFVVRIADPVDPDAKH